MRKLALVLCLFGPCSALCAENPWVGRWKLDLNKSHFANSFAYTQTADGMMHYVDGPDVTNFRIDGKPYTTEGILTSTWVASGEGAWDTVHKAGDVVEATTHRQLSADSKTFTMTTDGKAPDGSTFHDVEVYTRVSGTTGLLGRWRSTSFTSTSTGLNELLILPSDPGTYHQQIPSFHTEFEGKTDGSDAPLKGPTVPAGVTMALKVASPRSFTYTVKMDGKVMSEGVQTLAEDEKTITDVSWTKGNDATKSTTVYVRE